VQLKITTRGHFIFSRVVIIKWTITNVDKDMKKLELSYIAYRNVKWYSHLGKLLGNFSKRLSIA
jgi:hypothetical protein